MRIRTTGMWGILLFCLATIAVAGTPPPPRTISYQGRLTDSGGSPVADGSYNVNFAIWNSPTSTSLSNKVWESGSVSVATSSGLFTVDLGAPGQAELPDSIFVLDSNLYLGMAVNGAAEMTPRTKLTSVAYAYEAGTVPDSSLTSAKITDEAGLTFGTTGTITLTTASSTMSDIVTISIDAPAKGYIMVQAGGEYALSAGTGNANFLSLQIDQTAGGTENGSNYELLGTSDTPNSAYADGSFFVAQGYVINAAGQYTFRLEARNEYDANNYFWSPHISATYFPTYYGFLLKSRGPSQPLDTAYVDGQVPVRETHMAFQPSMQQSRK